MTEVFLEPPWLHWVCWRGLKHQVSWLAVYLHSCKLEGCKDGVYIYGFVQQGLHIWVVANVGFKDGFEQKGLNVWVI